MERCYRQVDLIKATADKQLRVSDRGKRALDRHRREGESHNDGIERLPREQTEADFSRGFGIFTNEAGN